METETEDLRLSELLRNADKCHLPQLSVTEQKLAWDTDVSYVLVTDLAMLKKKLTSVEN